MSRIVLLFLSQNIQNQANSRQNRLAVVQTDRNGGFDKFVSPHVQAINILVVFICFLV